MFLFQYEYKCDNLLSNVEFFYIHITFITLMMKSVIFNKKSLSGAMKGTGTSPNTGLAPSDHYGVLANILL